VQKLIKNSQPFVRKRRGGIFLTHTVYFTLA